MHTQKSCIYNGSIFDLNNGYNLEVKDHKKGKHYYFIATIINKYKQTDVHNYDVSN